jgi:hypothetical protein
MIMIHKQVGLLLVGIAFAIGATSCKEEPKKEASLTVTQSLPTVLNRDSLAFKWGTKKTEIVNTLLKREGIRTDPAFPKTFVTPEIHFRGGMFFGRRVDSWSFAYSDSLGLYYAQVVFTGDEKISEVFQSLDAELCKQYNAASIYTPQTGRITYTFTDQNEMTLSYFKLKLKPPTVVMDFTNQTLLDSAIALAEKKR